MTAWGKATHSAFKTIIFYSIRSRVILPRYHCSVLLFNIISLCRLVSSHGVGCLSHLVIADHQPCAETLDKNQAHFQWVISFYHNTKESNAGSMGRKYETRRAWVEIMHSTPSKRHAQDLKELIAHTSWISITNVKCICKLCQVAHFLISRVLRKDHS